MGKRKNIYFKEDDIVLKLEQEPNAAELISSLLRDHYNQSLEFLESKKDDLITETKLVELKIQNILKRRNANKRITKDMQIKKKQIESKKEIIDKIQILNSSGKILDDDYFSLFENGKLNIKKAKRYL